MSRLLFIASVICFAFVPLKESLHILQQNRYQNARYRTWLWDMIRQRKQELGKSILFLMPFAVLCTLRDEALAYRLSILLLWLYAYIIYRLDQRHTYIKPLIYTHRAKRMLSVHIVLFGLWVWLLSCLLPWRVLVFCMPFVFYLPWVHLIIAAMLCEPLERTIKRWYVEDAKDRLAKRPDLMRVAITGSYGKTSVKHILHGLLSEQYYTYMSPHSFNNLMGLTLSIRTQLKALHQIFIAEMGADHVGEIRQLAHLIQPRFAIITAVGPQHLATFGSLERIAAEKMSLVEQLPKDGTAVLNYDNEIIRNYPLRNSCHILTYGIHYTQVDVRASQIQYSSQGTSFWVEVKDGERFALTTRLLGEHNVLNLLAAITAAIALGVPIKKIQGAVSRLPYIEHRLEVHNMGNFHLLDDAYNSNPLGASYALQVLAAMEGKHFLLTPGFLDLGRESKQAHIAYAKEMMKCADEILLIGKTQTRDIADTLRQEGYPDAQIHVCDSTREAFVLLRQMAQKGDWALIENDLPDAFNY